MLFFSTSTFPYFGDILTRANISINELNEEENGSHNHSVKKRISSFYSMEEFYKILSEHSTTLSSIVYFLKHYADYIPEVCTPPPQYTQPHSA